MQQKKILLFDRFKRRLKIRKTFGKTKCCGLRYFSYSFPMICIMVLLAGLVYGICFISPDYNNAYAEGTGDEDYGIMPLATANPSASLTVGGSSSASLTTNTTPGNTAYASTNVTYSATDTTAYTLQATYANGNTSLKYDGTSGTTIGGAGGKAGSSLGDNTWGFAWVAGSTAESAYANQTYYTMPAYGTKGTSLSTGRLENGTSVTSTTKKIIFAAKFSSNATTGHYKTKVLLSLSATPKATYYYSLAYNANNGTGAPGTQTANNQDTTSYTFTISSTKPTRTGYDFLGWADSSTATTAQYSSGSTITLQSSSPSKTIYAVWKSTAPTVQGFGGITKMQDMTSTVCNSVAKNAAGQLYDTRDNSTYTIAKLSDGKCWMTQNLRITRETIKAKDSSNTTGTVTSADTNTNSNYNIPASTDSAFNATQSGSYYTNQQVRAAADNGYGAYYSYNVATLNKVASQSSGTATYDICPKGWRLPTGNTTGEFQALYDKWTTATWTTNNGKNGRWLGAANAASGGAFFPAAGLVYTGDLVYTGSEGYYWSNTIYNATYAYVLGFGGGGVNPAGNGERYVGNSVRCVAK